MGQATPDASLYNARATVFLRVGGNATWPSAVPRSVLRPAAHLSLHF